MQVLRQIDNTLPAPLASTHPEHGTVATDRTCVLHQLFGVARREFIEAYLGKQPFLSTRPIDPSLLATLPTISQVQGLAAIVAFQPDSLRYARSGDPAALPAPRMADGRFDMEALWRQYHDGASIVLNSLHKVDPGCKSLSDRLVIALGHRLQANAYLTPGSTGAFPTHYDTHDVIVVQLAGSKAWHIYDRPPAVPPIPHRIYPNTGAPELETGPFRVLELEEGSVLYLPRGYPHRAEAKARDSFHITFGLVPLSVAQMLKTAIDVLEGSEAQLREHVSADLFVDPSLNVDLASSAASLLRALSLPGLGEKTLATARKQALKDSSISVRPPLGLSAGEETMVRLRSDCYVEIRDTGDGSLVVTNGIKATSLSGADAMFFRELVDAGGRGLRRIYEPGDCDYLLLVRRLSALGMVEMVPLLPDDR